MLLVKVGVNSSLKMQKYHNLLVAPSTPILFKPAVLVQSQKRARRLKNKLFKILKTLDGLAAGLAAPQVGEPFAACLALDTSGKTCFFLNPKIVRREGNPYQIKEGCLSFPFMEKRVLRYPHVVVEYQDEKLKNHVIELFDFPAQVIQHETDHLQGITIG